jgi:hypothetical protein
MSRRRNATSPHRHIEALRRLAAWTFPVVTPRSRRSLAASRASSWASGVAAARSRVETADSCAKSAPVRAAPATPGVARSQSSTARARRHVARSNPCAAATVWNNEPPKSGAGPSTFGGAPTVRRAGCASPGASAHERAPVMKLPLVPGRRNERKGAASLIVERGPICRLVGAKGLEGSATGLSGCASVQDIDIFLVQKHSVAGPAGHFGRDFELL